MKNILILFLALSLMFSVFLLLQKDKLILEYNNTEAIVDRQQDSIQKALMHRDNNEKLSNRMYEAFILWKRESEIDEGDLSCYTLFEPSSYSFIFNRTFETHSFFVPYNVFPEEVHNYLSVILDYDKINNLG